MTIPITGKRPEEDTTKTGHHRGGRRIRGGKNLEQMSSEGKGEVLGTMERIYSRRRYMGE